MNTIRKTTCILFFLTSYIVTYGQYQIVEEEGYSHQIGIMVNMLEDLKIRITEEVDSLTIEQTDFLFDEKANSIGALIMHLAATESYYQVESLEERTWTEEETIFWEVPSGLGKDTREKYKGNSIQYYLDIWDQVREKTLIGLQARNDEWFGSNIEDGMNYHWVWYHVMEHQANHMGQIALIKNRLSEKVDYRLYHTQTMEAEILIANENYIDALKIYNMLFESYEFAFLRDYQIATQLAFFLNNEDEGKRLLRNSIKSGWTMKSIKKNNFLNPFRKSEGFNSIKKEYPQLHSIYVTSINQPLRDKVEKMYKRDQKKAFGALFRLSSKAQDKYAETKFAPHSEKQIKEFLDILSEYGYPGEKLIGTETWMSTVLSHNNSISKQYNEKDTLYQNFKPKLEIALEKGEISPFSYIMIEEWYRAVVDNKDLPTFGILDGPFQKDLTKTNKLRADLYLRSIEIHNKLIDAQEKTGMDFYLDGHPWNKRKIEIR